MPNGSMRHHEENKYVWYFVACLLTTVICGCLNNSNNYNKQTKEGMKEIERLNSLKRGNKNKQSKNEHEDSYKPRYRITSLDGKTLRERSFIPSYNKEMMDKQKSMGIKKPYGNTEMDKMLQIVDKEITERKNASGKNSNNYKGMGIDPSKRNGKSNYGGYIPENAIDRDIMQKHGQNVPSHPYEKNPGLNPYNQNTTEKESFNRPNGFNKELQERFDNAQNVNHNHGSRGKESILFTNTSPDAGSFVKSITSKPKPENTTKLSPPFLSTTRKRRYYVDAGSFTNQDDAVRTSQKLTKMLNMPVEPMRETNKANYQIKIGPLNKRKDAEVLVDKLVAGQYYDVAIVE